VFPESVAHQLVQVIYNRIQHQLDAFVFEGRATLAIVPTIVPGADLEFQLL